MLDIKIPQPTHNFSSNTYVLCSGGEYAVIDPSVPYDKSVCPGELKYILLTHSHFDHILDIDSWVDAGGKVLISKHEIDFLPDPMKNCYGLFFGQTKGYFGEAHGVSEGDAFNLGDETITVLEVPGHTDGSLIYKIGEICFVGDTVFDGGGYGRFDLPSGNAAKLKSSIERIHTFPLDTVLYPGHGGPTTVKKHKQDFLR